MLLQNKLLVRFIKIFYYNEYKSLNGQSADPDLEEE